MEGGAFGEWEKSVRDSGTVAGWQIIGLVLQQQLGYVKGIDHKVHNSYKEVLTNQLHGRTGCCWKG